MANQYLIHMVVIAARYPMRATAMNRKGGYHLNVGAGGDKMKMTMMNYKIRTMKMKMNSLIDDKQGITPGP